VDTPTILIETVEIDASGSRQISTRARVAELLEARRGEIIAAMREGASLTQESFDSVEAGPRWAVSKLEATFGITVAAETGIVLTKVSGEASFHVTVTVERR
jgi:hypothetical protein